VKRWRRLAWLALAAIAAVGAAGAASLLAEHGHLESVLAHETLPFYGSADLLPRWDFIASMHRVERFALQDQRGQAIDERLLDRGPTVVSFFFAGCATVCPVSTDLLRRTRTTLAERGREQAPAFVSITVAPLSDGPASLREFSKRFALGDDWTLMTGEPKRVARLAQRAFFIDIEAPGIGAEPPHIDRAFLVDGSRRIRGIYDATSTNEMQRLGADLDRLRAETPQRM
jgi:protein SCO1